MRIKKDIVHIKTTIRYAYKLPTNYYVKGNVSFGQVVKLHEIPCLHVSKLRQNVSKNGFGSGCKYALVICSDLQVYVLHSF